jgi:hypothetical protein
LPHMGRSKNRSSNFAGPGPLVLRDA